MAVLSQQWGKEIETTQAKIQSLKFFYDTPQLRLDGKFRTCNLKIKLDDARVKLKQAEIEQKISGISADWDAKMRSHQNPVKIFKVSGNDLINIESVDSDPMVKKLNQLKEVFQGMNSGEDYDAEPYTFRIPSARTKVC